MALVAGALLLLFGASRASASQEVIDYFGTEVGAGTLGGQFLGARDVAVNYSGAGPADAGDVYVADGEGLNGGRVQRFAHDDNGTPAEPYDDSYDFVSAWGADVVQPGGVGDQGDSSDGNFEICTVSSQCKEAVLISGNGTVAGNGAMYPQAGLAVDQDTGRVYVLDAISFTFGNNARVNVYEGDGAFLYSFGFDVDATAPGVGYEICPAASVCKGGLPGNGSGQIDSGEKIAVSPPDGNPSTGVVYVADAGSHRINTYDLDGGDPSSFGSSVEFPLGPRTVAVDSRGIVYASRGDVGEIQRYDSANANGGGIGFLASLSAGSSKDLEVDPDSDSGGPDEDILYSLRQDSSPTVVVQFGPVNDPGLLAPPVAADDQHGSLVGFKQTGSLGVDPVSSRLFVSADFQSANNQPDNAPPAKHGVYVLGPSGGAPSVSLDSVTDVTATSATVEGTINPNSGPPVSYSLEYSFDGVEWSETGKILLGIQTTDQPISIELDPPGTGLEPGTLYHVRLVATKAFAVPVVSAEQTFTTDSEAPRVETVGSPVRTTTTARLEGRVNPRNASTTYRFEYLDDAVYQANVTSSQPPFTGAVSTAPQPAGAGSLSRLVSAWVEGLDPGTTYHYRLLADNGKSSNPSAGEEMIVATRASDAPLDHGPLPGPPGSDRAYEQVNLDDTGGNPVAFALGFSDDGNRALYGIAGGTPISDTGSFGSVYYAERVGGGWQTRKITPPRAELFGGTLGAGGVTSDLSTVLMESFEVGTAGAAAWGLAPAGQPSKLFQTAGSQKYTIESGSLSDDGSRVAAVLQGPSLDLGHPEAGSKENLYDISSGTPQLASLLPDGTVANCGIVYQELAFGLKARLSRWLSADGQLAFFPSSGDDCTSEPQLFMRDFEAGETKLVSGPTLLGSSCAAAFLKVTPDAAFFWTKSQLVSSDTPRADCDGTSGGDVYRYDLATEALKCVTCAVAGLDANVAGGDQSGTPGQIAVSDDGSRVYFTAGSALLPGTPAGGTYRVEVASGDLAYVGQGSVGVALSRGNALTPDGSVLIFRSDDTALNPLGGSDNGGTAQYYRYDDRDRSLVCISCPQDGSVSFTGIPGTAALSVGSSVGPNTPPVSDDGGVVAFAAPTALVDVDQNTPQQGQGAEDAGTDVYEWRDGRLFLITDGLTNWAPESEPEVAGISPSGDDIYFMAAAQYTQDALDGYKRLYDARVGGGFEFPPPPRPCPLEVCQGTPKGAPVEQEPGSGVFSGRGNPAEAKTTRRCPKGRRALRRAGRTRCVKRRQGQGKAKKNRASKNRRAAR